MPLKMIVVANSMHKPIRDNVRLEKENAKRKRATRGSSGNNTGTTLFATPKLEIVLEYDGYVPDWRFEYLPWWWIICRIIVVNRDFLRKTILKVTPHLVVYIKCS